MYDRRIKMIESNWHQLDDLIWADRATIGTRTGQAGKVTRVDNPNPSGESRRSHQIPIRFCKYPTVNRIQGGIVAVQFQRALFSHPST